MKLTTITLFQNTPFTDLYNTIDFGSNSTRDTFFDEHYTQHTYESRFDFVRDRLTLRVPTQETPFAFTSQVNYARFKSDMDDVMYYAMVIDTRYLNDGTTELQLIIDGLMTFGQGGIHQYAKNVQVERQHLTAQTKSDNIQYLRTNSDVLQYNTLAYVDQQLYEFADLSVVFLSSADLSTDFGDVDNPKIKTSHGQSHDGITAPQSIYVIRNYQLFNDYMRQLADYPWIAQNISSVKMVPADMIDLDDLEPVSGETINFSGLTTFKNNTKSSFNDRMKMLNRTLDDIADTFHIDLNMYPELMRQPYTNIEMIDWRGQSIPLDPAFLPEQGIELAGEVTTGYHNEAYIFPRYYKSRGEQHVDGLYEGTYLHNAIAFTNFDDAPVLVDNYKLSMASNANKRQLAEDRLVTNRVGNLVNPNADLKSRLFDAASVLSNVSPTAIGGKLTDEYEFYRDQKAEFADMKISKPTISNMGTENSFVIGRNIYGVTIKYSAIDDHDLQAAARYHANFGYQWQGVSDLEPTDSMSHLNFVKFKGNWNINDRQVPQSIMEQIRIQCENGVKIWHNPDNLENPFNQDITLINKAVK